MSQVALGAIEEEVGLGIVNMYNNLLKEWLYDLTLEEKQIWLWNAKVEMIRIKQRRAQL